MNGFPCMFPIDMVEPYATVLAGFAMKTTLNLNDQVLRSAKGRAARDGITLTRFVEDALRARLTDAGSRKPAFRPGRAL